MLPQPKHGAVPLKRNGRPDYQVDGQKVPSVTEIVKKLGNPDALIGWANKIGREYGITTYEYLSKMAGAGTLAHAMVESHLKGKQQPSTAGYTQEQVKMAEQAFDNFLEWESHVNLRVISTEISLVSKELLVGGTIDIVAFVTDVPAILDLKTSKAVQPEHRAQVAVYKAIWNENFPTLPADPVYILQLTREDAAFSWHKVGPAQEHHALEAFKHIRRAFNHLGKF